MNDPVVEMFRALRAMVDALEASVVQPEEPVRQGCEHPAEQRDPNPVSGKPSQFLCRACHMLVNPDALMGQE